MIRKSIAKIIFLPVISFFVVFLTLILVFRFAVPRIIARREAAEYYVEASDEQSFVENTTYENSDSSSGEENSNISEEDEEKLRKNGAEEWVIALCMQARYIFPRAHIAQMIRRDAFCLYGAEEVSPSDRGHCVLQDSFIG